MTKPDLNRIKKSERLLSEEIDGMVQTAVDTAERVLAKPGYHSAI